MKTVSLGYHYWIQYEGVPGGAMDLDDFWFSSSDKQKHLIEEPFVGDLPSPEWMAFGDNKSPRMLFMLHHQDDNYPDNYESRPDMTVFAFGRSQKSKFLKSPQRFSIGFVESDEYDSVQLAIEKILP